MPIKPENRARYPKAWPQIRAAILERAGNRCEGSPDFPDCRRPNGWALNKRTGELTENGEQADTWYLVDGDPTITIVLTIAHLDHTPENCALENLKAMCQRCHLNYDKHHHAQTAYATRHSRRAIADLFDRT